MGNLFDEEGEPASEWLRRERLRAGLHQHQLAARLDINQGRISEWETGFKPLPVYMKERISYALGITN